ncbi:MAG: hypothetical protein ACJ8KU_01465 [Chthoniobacterales bacterium]
MTIERRTVVAWLITVLLVVAVWKFIDYRMQPPPPPAQNVINTP